MSMKKQETYVDGVRKHKGLMKSRKFFDRVRNFDSELIYTRGNRYNTECLEIDTE